MKSPNRREEYDAGHVEKKQEARRVNGRLSETRIQGFRQAGIPSGFWILASGF
jgi:hypothetical protein